MRMFYENFPFFCVFLALLSGILTTLIRNGKKARAVTLAMLLCAAVLNGAVFLETSLRNVNFSYAMGAFPAPWGNELRAGPVESTDKRRSQADCRQSGSVRNVRPG